MMSLAWCMKFSLLNIAAVIKSLLLSQLFLMSFCHVRKRFGLQGKAPIWLPLHFSSSTHKPHLVHSTQRFDKFWFWDKPWVWNKADHKGQNKYLSTPDCMLLTNAKSNKLVVCMHWWQPTQHCMLGDTSKLHKNWKYYGHKSHSHNKPNTFFLCFRLQLSSQFCDVHFLQQRSPSSSQSFPSGQPRGEEALSFVKFAYEHFPVKHHWGPQLQ